MDNKVKDLQIHHETKLDDLLRMSRMELAEALLRVHSKHAPLVDVQLREGLQKEDFGDLDIEWNSKTGRSMKIVGVDIDLVDFSYFNTPSLVDKYLEFESSFRKKKSNMSSSRTREVSNSIRIYFKFVKDHASVDGALDIRHLLNEDCLNSFNKWCNAFLKNPSTITNHFKYFSQFWKWLKGQECAKEWVSRLEHLDNAFKNHRQKLKELKSAGERKVSCDLLLVMGKWLSEEDDKDLVSIAGENFAKLVEADERFVHGASEKSIYKIRERLIIMDHVYLLGMIYCGGQRREFVQMMDVENLRFSSTEDQYYVPEEKTVRQNTNYFILPKEYSVPLRVWITKYVPTLRANEGVLSPWITMHGTPQKDSKMSERMSKLVAHYFPGHWITPLYFRRKSVTKVTQENLTSKGVVFDPVLAESHAMLINTSPAVMRQHYDRFNRSKVNKQTLDKVNDILGARPGDRLAEFVRRQSERFAKQEGVTARSVKRVFNHEFTGPYNLFYFVEYQDGSTARIPALQALDFLSQVKIYLACIGGLSNNDKLTYKKVSAEGFSMNGLIERSESKKRKIKVLDSLSEKVPRVCGDDDLSEDDALESESESESCSEGDFESPPSGAELRVSESVERVLSKPVASASIQPALPPVDCYVLLESFEEEPAVRLERFEEEPLPDSCEYDSDWMFDCDFDEDWDYSRPPPKKKTKVQ